jgi:hypothetical protein
MKKISDLFQKKKWIIDGMCSHGSTMDLRFQASDLIIFLDINRFICLCGVIKRNGKERSDTVINHWRNEKFDKIFFEFCKQIINFNKTKKIKIFGLHKKYPEKRFFIISSRRKMNNLIRKWKNDKMLCHDINVYKKI